MNIKRTTKFQPDYNHLLEVLENRRPDRLPLYEHHINPPFVSKALGRELTPKGTTKKD